jgi:hypothetical protein
MAYSNTTGQTKVNVDQLISYAFRDAGKIAEEITPEYIDAGKQALFYNLQNLSNRGVNLWLLENQLYGTVTAQQQLVLPASTIDVREANWVYIQNLQISQALPLTSPSAAILFSGNLNGYATSTISQNWFGASFSPSAATFYVGFNAYVPGNNIANTATYNIAYETSNDLVTWTTRQVFPATTLHDTEWAYFNISTTPQYTYYRLRETVLPTFSLRQIVFSQSQQVIPLARLNRDDYWNLPNKQFGSNRSLQYWFDRTIEPSMYLWPVPNNDFQMFQLIIETQMMDVGSLTNEIYVPDRWLPCIQAQLSHKLSMQLPSVDMARVTYLEGQAEKLFMQAADEDRDKSPIYFQPNYSYYTR